jgi:PST family polysaccharide transporter
MGSSAYGRILRSTAITGGARIVTLLLSFLRFKLVALFAGPAGFGLLGLFNASLALVSSLSSLGLDASGVRQIAARVGASAQAGDAGEIIVALRRLSLVTGLCGALSCLLLAEEISNWTFGTPDYAFDFRLLSVCVLLAQLSLGQSAVLRGLRKIKELALQSIVVSFLILLVSAGLLALLGKDGLVPMLVASSVVTLGGTWWYARRVPVGSSKQALSETLGHAKALVSLGVAFLLGGLAASAGNYLIGVMIHGQGGAAANGLYQAAWSCTGALAGFVLGAMGQDFYPQLTALADDKPAASKLIDQQVEVGLLMALPGLSIMVALSPILVPLLFTSEFAGASELINWMALGCLGRVLSWPLGYYLLSCGLGRWFVLTEFLFVALHLLMVWLLLPVFGLVGASISFALLYLAYWLGMIFTVRAHSGFFRSVKTYQLAVASAAVILVCGLLVPAAGLCLSLVTGIWCLRRLVGLLGPGSRFARHVASIPLLGPYLLP